MVAVAKLTEEQDPRFARATELARQYIYGIQGQADPNSPTGWWRGMGRALRKQCACFQRTPIRTICMKLSRIFSPITDGGVFAR